MPTRHRKISASGPGIPSTILIHTWSLVHSILFFTPGGLSLAPSSSTPSLPSSQGPHLETLPSTPLVHTCGEHVDDASVSVAARAAHALDVACG